MGQKKAALIFSVLLIIGLIVSLLAAFSGIVINQYTPAKDFLEKDKYIWFIVLFIALATASLTVFATAFQEEDSDRRKLLISGFFAFIGLGGVLIYGVKFIEKGWSSSESIVVSPSSPSTPTPKPTEPTPKPEPTPSSEPTPSVETNIPKLVKDSFSFETVGVNERGEIVKRESKTTSMWIEDLGEGIQLEMIYVPGGSFRMGSPAREEGQGPDERPQREVTIQPFLMGRFMVTQSQWKRVSTFTRIQVDFESDPSFFKGNLRPVEFVNWYEAKEFCDRLSTTTGREYRLPTEAEWEYACRANTTTPFYFGETVTPELANYDGNYKYGRGPKGQYRKQTTEVGKFPPNAYGLFDTHGNLREWCADVWVNGQSRANAYVS
jgi:formylglycine-generating enzyme required for sulfatase activity